MAISTSIELNNQGVRVGLGKLHVKMIAFLLTFLAMVIIVKSLVYVHGDEKVYVVDGQSTLTSHQVGIPFFSNIKDIDVDQSVFFNLQGAPTKNGVYVRGVVTGNFKLIQEELNVQRLVNTFDNPNQEIQKGLSRLVWLAVEPILLQNNFGELKRSFNFKLGVKEQIEAKKLGVISQEIKVSNLRGYFE